MMSSDNLNCLLLVVTKVIATQGTAHCCLNTNFSDIAIRVKFNGSWFTETLLNGYDGSLPVV